MYIKLIHVLKSCINNCCVVIDTEYKNTELFNRTFFLADFVESCIGMVFVTKS